MNLLLDILLCVGIFIFIVEKFYIRRILFNYISHMIWGVSNRGKISEITYFYHGKFWKIPLKITRPSKMYTSPEIQDYLGPGGDMYNIHNLTPKDLGFKKVNIEHAFTDKHFDFGENDIITFN